MSFSKKINKIRKRAMRKLTRWIGSGYALNQRNLSAIKVRRILVVRPNHRLGNLLLITPLLQEILRTFPDIEIDLLVTGSVAPTLFRSYKIRDVIELPKIPFKKLPSYLKGWFRATTRQYDIVFNAVPGSSSGRLVTALSRGKAKWHGDLGEETKRRYPDHVHDAKNPIYGFRTLMQAMGIDRSAEPIPSLNLRLKDDELEEGKSIVKKVTGSQKPAICIFTFATGEKCYAPEWWEPFYERLKKEYPAFNIMEMLPVENVSQISFKAPSFYSKDVREIASVIANTDVFIGADSGMMHLACSSGTPTVGLFKVTNPEVFGPYGNGSVAVDTRTKSIDEIIAVVNKILENRRTEKASTNR